ncbi:hypothetical protein Ga0074812_102419 [Parafrankia irregularis]|uniref:Uncharacterized protein n=1 Tax=Parafrankia irregularis TaxID=795642 RepID=A0A0S4QGM5_9ACTN|nr:MULTISPECIES: hypothetical protein [Parafrankia]MBE3202961.1 hypothetical protein [Parafrankia sp. CH37]CUU54409.1 hypothetical protein Ga0074812_102419 [Parafrankia irregularis]
MTDTDADPGFELHLRARMASVARTIQQPSDLAQHVIERGRRHRRRKALAAAVALTVAAVGAVVVPQVLPEKESAIYPADTSVLSSPLDSVYGVDVRWLPDGYGVRSRQPENLLGGLDSDLSSSQIATDYSSLPTTARFSPHTVRYTPDSPNYTVTVSRDPKIDLEARMRQMNEAAVHPVLGRPRLTSGVGGHRAYAYTMGDGSENLIYWLTWSPAPAVVLTVRGPSETDIRKIAESLVVGPAPHGPRDPGQSLQVEQAARDAFTPGSGTTPWAALDRVQGGDGLRAAMDEAVRTDRKPVESIRVTSTGPVTFLSETEAMIILLINAQERQGRAMSEVAWAASVRMIRTADGWKVRKQDYCTHMTWALICPPITIS